jgi:hypothetical protein
VERYYIEMTVVEGEEPCLSLMAVLQAVYEERSGVSLA